MNTGENRNLEQEDKIIWRYWREVCGLSEEQIINMPADEFYSIDVFEAEIAIANQ